MCYLFQCTWHRSQNNERMNAINTSVILHVYSLDVIFANIVVSVCLFVYFPACNCHGKTKECYYNQTIADRNQSLNVYGEYIGGGVCINCASHTEGINCETCIDGYFRPKEVKYALPFPLYISCSSSHHLCVKS